MGSQAEFLAIGNELLLGDTINSNGATVARALTTIGVSCSRHVAVGDDPAAIGTALAEALTRAPFVIVCGGLGPTEDDLTRGSLSAALGLPLIRDARIEAELRERFKSFGRTMPERNVVQADVLEGARVIDTTFGTAPGMIIDHNESVIYVLPGVPSELEEMMNRAVLPDIASRIEVSRIASRVINIAGVPESEIAQRLRSVYESLPDGIAMAYLPAAGEVKVKLTASGANERDIFDRLRSLETRIAEIMGRSIVGVDEQDLDVRVASMLKERGWMLGTAESLTGGALGERCTRIPGSSDWFKGCVVAYATEVKRDLLGVPEELIEAHGVVSPEVARAMAAGALRILGCDIVVALTGVAGPSEQGKAVGTVCVAVEGPGIRSSREARLPGDRQRIREYACTLGLTVLLKCLQDVSN